MRKIARLTLLLAVTALVGMAGQGCGNRRPSLARDGGTVLLYEVENAEWDTADATRKEALREAVRNRFSSYAQRGVQVEVSGPRVKVEIPGDDAELVKRVKMLLAYSGQLEFLIVANPIDHSDLIDAARKSQEREVRDGDTIIGRWVTIGRSKSGTDELLVPFSGLVTRDADTKQPIEVTAAEAQDFESKRVSGKEWLAERRISTVEALLVLDPRPALNIEGHHLLRASDSFDENARPCINFTMTEEGAVLLERLSSSNLPDANTGTTRRMGIVLDQELLTAPSIQSTIAAEGRITGDFSLEEVRAITSILKAGRLPFRLSLVSETKVSEQR